MLIETKKVQYKGKTRRWLKTILENTESFPAFSADFKLTSCRIIQTCLEKVVSPKKNLPK